jgi:hypothetical protein
MCWTWPAELVMATKTIGSDMARREFGKNENEWGSIAQPYSKIQKKPKKHQTNHVAQGHLSYCNNNY